MKTKKSPVGQFIVEGIGDTEEAYEYVQSLMPLIGEVVIFFNALEADLDHYLCSQISDRSDQKGLLVLGNMMFASKVELFTKFSTEILRAKEIELDWFPKLISDLKECGTLRNKVVHANWMQTNDEGYTHVKIKYGKRGLEHEMCQFDEGALNMVLEKIDEARNWLDYLIIEHIH